MENDVSIDYLVALKQRRKQLVFWIGSVENALINARAEKIVLDQRIEELEKKGQMVLPL